MVQLQYFVGVSAEASHLGEGLVVLAAGVSRVWRVGDRDIAIRGVAVKAHIALKSGETFVRQLTEFKEVPMVEGFLSWHDTLNPKVIIYYSLSEIVSFYMVME